MLSVLVVRVGGKRVDLIKYGGIVLSKRIGLQRYHRYENYPRNKFVGNPIAGIEIWIPMGLGYERVEIEKLQIWGRKWGSSKNVCSPADEYRDLGKVPA